MARQNILVVDDDERSRRVLEVTLRNAGYSVATAADGGEALTRIEAAAPALVISDTEMPNLDGFELCRRFKADERYRDVPFLFLSEQNALEDKIRGLELGADDYLAKPMYIKEVVARVRIALQKRERALLDRREKRRFYGSLEDMGVVDLLTTVELGRKSGVIRMERGGQPGCIWVGDGKVVDAEVGRLRAEDAVYRLLTWEHGTFEGDFGPVDRPARVTAGVQQLLMEGMRRVDEWGRMLEQLPTIDTVFQVDYTELAERLAELPDEVNALLRLFDGQQSAMQAIDDSTLSDLDALAAISRLYFEGIIYEVGARQETLPATLDTPRPNGEKAPGELKSWLSEMMGPTEQAPDGGVDEADFSEFKEDSGAPGLVDELLTSVTSMPRAVRSPEPSQGPPIGGALPADLALPTSPSETPAADVDEDARRVRNALRLDGTPSPMVTEPAPRPVVAAADIGHDQFFDRRDAEQLASIEAEAPIRDEEPVSKIAYVVIGVAVAALLSIVGFFVLRDQVEPREEPKGVMASGWHDEVLKSRPTPSEIAPIEDTIALPAPGSQVPAAPPSEVAAPSSEAAPASVGDVPPPAPPGQAGRFEDALKQGLSLYQKGDYQQAMASFERATGLRPGSEEALLGYANTLLELNRGNEAQRAAEKVTKLNPKSARAHLIIGTVRQDAGDKDAAVAAYRKYLELAPDDRYAEQVRWIVEHRLR